MSLRCQINELKQRFVLNGVLALSAKGVQYSQMYKS